MPSQSGPRGKSYGNLSAEEVVMEGQDRTQEKQQQKRPNKLQNMTLSSDIKLQRLK
jgi:hypothetical protein